MGKKTEVSYYMEDVTPAMATKWLEQNTHNRVLRQSKIEEYARDMTNGRWYLSHQGIAFNCENVLVDGQHRLWAVIESGKTVPMLIMEGLPLESQLVIDAHAVRQGDDYLNLDQQIHAPVTKLEVSTLSRMMVGLKGVSMKKTHHEVKALYLEHKPALKFAMSCMVARKPRVRTAAVLGVIARAYYSKYSKDDIRKFCAILMGEEGPGAKYERVAMNLRDSLMLGKDNRALQVYQAYAKTQTALLRFLQKRPVVRLRQENSEIFLLPGEKRRSIADTPTRRGSRIFRAFCWARTHKEFDGTTFRKRLNLDPSHAASLLASMGRNGWIEVTKKGRPNHYKFIPSR